MNNTEKGERDRSPSSGPRRTEMKQKKRTRAARKVRRLVRRVSVEMLTRAMPKYGIPSIKDHPEYIRGYSDAVAKLHSLLTPNAPHQARAVASRPECGCSKIGGTPCA